MISFQLIQTMNINYKEAPDVQLEPGFIGITLFRHGFEISY